GPQPRDGIRLDGEHADAHHGAVVLEDLGHADLAADESDAHYILISMSTPAARLSRINASTVFDDGSRMSTSRLCVRISNCSRLCVSINGERRTANVSMRGGRGTAQTTSPPCRCAVS